MIAKVTIILLISTIIYLIINLTNQEKFIILEKNHKAKEIAKKNTKIPCKIWQTHETNDLPNSSFKNILRLIKNNPEFEYNFFTKEDRFEYLKKHYNRDVLNAYTNIKSGAGKADIWRLAVILREGGIYIDVDKVPTQNAVSFISLIDPDDEMIHGRNWHVWGFDAPAVNSTICARPNHPIIKSTFDSVINAVNNKKPLKKIGKHEGWAELECYTGTPHLWKALSEHTGNIDMIEGKYSNGLVISNKIEDNLKQNPEYGNDLKELKVKHWSQESVFN